MVQKAANRPRTYVEEVQGPFARDGVDPLAVSPNVRYGILGVSVLKPTLSAPGSRGPVRVGTLAGDFVDVHVISMPAAGTDVNVHDGVGGLGIDSVLQAGVRGLAVAISSPVNVADASVNTGARVNVLVGGVNTKATGTTLGGGQTVLHVQQFDPGGVAGQVAARTRVKVGGADTDVTGTTSGANTGAHVQPFDPSGVLGQVAARSRGRVAGADTDLTAVTLGAATGLHVQPIDATGVLGQVGARMRVNVAGTSTDATGTNPAGAIEALDVMVMDAAGTKGQTLVKVSDGLANLITSQGFTDNNPGVGVPIRGLSVTPRPPGVSAALGTVTTGAAGDTAVIAAVAAQRFSIRKLFIETGLVATEIRFRFGAGALLFHFHGVVANDVVSIDFPPDAPWIGGVNVAFNVNLSAADATGVKVTALYDKLS